MQTVVDKIIKGLLFAHTIHKFAPTESLLSKFPFPYMSASRIFSDKSAKWIEKIWCENASQIYKQCRVRSSSKELADDLFQEVALRFCRSAANLDTATSLYSWFMTVIRHTHYELYRRNARLLPESYLSDQQALYSGVPEDAAVHCHNFVKEMLVKDELKFFMDALDPNERLITEITYLGGISIIEAANLFGLSKNSISKLRCSAILKMRDQKKLCDERQKKMESRSVLLEELLTPPAEIS